MACKCFTFKSHNLNNKLDSNDLVVAKFKPNPENDDYFYDDEERDWKDICWYTNKVHFGEAKQIKYKEDLKENELLEDFTEDQLNTKYDFVPNNIGRTKILGIIEDDQQYSKYYNTISDFDQNIGMIANLRNFLRITKIINMPKVNE